ncbi:uncharacterized protein JCM6883_007434 [Sporobolomyces salmoneus]|uniref:uncharacterized protein n=1 Tax=Sporobolomyces salmoneus TaxID=183962 RepID=UPI003173C2BE
MSPQLPVELLRLVLDDFRLPPFTSPLRTQEFERENEVELYDLCLISRTFRELAQPLLFAYIRLTEDNVVQTLTRLIQNNEDNGRLALVRGVYYDEWAGESIEKSSSNEANKACFRKFPTLATTLEEAILYTHWEPSQTFSTSSLKRLFLNKLNLDTARMSASGFPCLEVLGLWDVVYHPHLLELEPFPALRHLVYWGLEEHRTKALAKLAHQLDSVVILSDFSMDGRLDYSPDDKRLDLSPDFPIEKMLVNSPWDWDEDHVAVREVLVVHLRILVSDLGYNGDRLISCSQAIKNFAGRLKDQARFARLQSVFLPPRDSLWEEYHDEDIYDSLDDLATVCRNRNVEVVFEEQSDILMSQSQVSEEFMKRMTNKRIAREGGQS